MPPCLVLSPVVWLALTIDCADTEQQARLQRFYAEALGGEVVTGSVRARGLLLVFDVVADHRPPTWPSGETPKQMHFEWMVDDLDAAVVTMQDLGASLAEHQDPGEPHLRVLLDPAGHPFCLMTTGSVVPAFRDEARHQVP